MMKFLAWANERDTKHLFCVHAVQTGKHLLRTQNVSDKNQKHFLCLGHKFCVRNKCCAHWQTGKHLCPQHFVLVCHPLKGEVQSRMAIYFLYANKKFTPCFFVCQNACLCSSMFLKQRSKRYKKTFHLFFLTNKSHFKETRGLKYLHFPAKLQAELFDVTHTLLAPRWRRSVEEFWATLEKDFVGI